MTGPFKYYIWRLSGILIRCIWILAPKFLVIVYDSKQMIDQVLKFKSNAYILYYKAEKYNHYYTITL